MLNKEYPYNGQTEMLLFKDINSGKKLKKCDNEELNDLINKMLKINVNERISWEEYFNHSFFNNQFNQLDLPLFNILLVFVLVLVLELLVVFKFVIGVKYVNLLGDSFLKKE